MQKYAIYILKKLKIYWKWTKKIVCGQTHTCRPKPRKKRVLMPSRWALSRTRGNVLRMNRMSSVIVFRTRPSPQQPALRQPSNVFEEAFSLQCPKGVHEARAVSDPRQATEPSLEPAAMFLWKCSNHDVNSCLPWAHGLPECSRENWGKARPHSGICCISNCCRENSATK